MSEFINTIDLQGDQETLESLVSNIQTSFSDDRLTTLCAHALRGKTALESANLPNVTTVGDRAFNDATLLSSVSLPKATTIGTYAFSGDTALTSISLPSATTIGGYAFHWCKNLETVSLPEATSIGGDGAFNDCTSLTDVNLPNATSIGNYAFNECASLTDIYIPNAASIGNYAFNNAFSAGIIEVPKCTSLGTYVAGNFGAAGFDFTKKVTIKANAFCNCFNLSTLILRSNELCPLSSTSAFTNTPFTAGYGYIYVPADLVDTYKSGSNWSTYASRIKSLSSYPLPYDGDTITDTWEEIFEAEEDGTYSTKYAIGDTKILNICMICVPMQIAAFDADTLSDNTGTAKITWISKGSINFHDLGSSTANNWENSTMRQYLRSFIYPRIDSTVRNNIKEVHKTYYANGNQYATDDTVWIPSMREVCGSQESSGPIYNSLFSSNSARIKKAGPCSSAGNTAWWTRTFYSASNGTYIKTTGSNGNQSATGANLVVLGFCT